VKANRFVVAVFVCLSLVALLTWVLEAPVSPANASGRSSVQGAAPSATPDLSLRPGAVHSDSLVYLPELLRLHPPTATPTPTSTRTPTATSTATPTATPTATATATSSPPLFLDSFDSPCTHWDSGESSFLKWGCVAGEYQVYLKAAKYGVLSTPNLSQLPANYRVEADVRQVSANPVALGLAFDMKWDANPYAVYEFLIYPDTMSYTLEKRDLNGKWWTLLDWKDHSEINPLNETNHLRVDRVGNEIRLYINGVNVETYVDGELAGAGRDAGLRAYSTDRPEDVPSEARFDNFRVSNAP